MKNLTNKIHETFDQGKGILQLIPVFVPRRFSKAGRRLRLHPDDYYALGTKRGSIKERWFSSVIPAMNGELAPPDEGMSYVLPFSENLSEKFQLKQAVDELKDGIVGSELMNKYGGWPMYSKFFDYLAPLFHHLHLGSHVPFLFQSRDQLHRFRKLQELHRAISFVAQMAKCLALTRNRILSVSSLCKS